MKALPQGLRINMRVPRRYLFALGAVALAVAIPAAQAERVIEPRFVGLWRVTEQQFGGNEHLGATLLLKANGAYDWDSRRKSPVMARSNYGTWDYDVADDEIVLVSRGLIGRLFRYRDEKNLWRAIARVLVSSESTNRRVMYLNFVEIGDNLYEPPLTLRLEQVSS